MKKKKKKKIHPNSKHCNITKIRMILYMQCTAQICSIPEAANAFGNNRGRTTQQTSLMQTVRICFRATECSTHYPVSNYPGNPQTSHGLPEVLKLLKLKTLGISDKQEEFFTSTQWHTSQQLFFRLLMQFTRRTLALNWMAISIKTTNFKS